MITIKSHADFEQYIGQKIGTSDYIQINQEQINLFADATFDHQWIHTDPKQAQEGPFKTTIAHGFLTLSVVPYLWKQIADIQNVRMLVNYGIEKLRFNQPVVVGSFVRLHVHLKGLINLKGVTKTEMDISLEIKENPKPAFTALIVFLYHFHRSVPS